MSLILRSVAFVAMGLIVASCTGNQSEQPTSEATQTATPPPAAPIAPTREPEGATTAAPSDIPTVGPTITPTTRATLAPLQLPERLPGGIKPLPSDTRTGIAELDRVIEALVGGDDATLIQLVGWELVPCSGRSGRSGLPSPPRCPSGISEGTLVEALYWGGNEGSYRTRESLEASGVFVIPTFSERDRSLCLVSQSQRDDGSLEYRVSMRVASYVPAYDSYEVNNFSVVLADGRITSAAHQVNPGASLAATICQ